MRVLLINAIVLVGASTILAQTTLPVSDVSVHAQERHSRPRAAGVPHTPAPRNVDVPPATPVVSLNGVCDPPRVASSRTCKTVITRAQMDHVLDLLLPNASPAARRQFAVNYARLLAASGVARQRHLDKDPSVIAQTERQVKVARMQVLADVLYRRIEQRAQALSPADIQKYYADHLSSFERGQVRRLALPKTLNTVDGKQMDSSAMKAKAEELRARAVAGGDFEQLQADAYKELDIKAVPPNTKLNMVGRNDLPPEQAKVFDLNPGEVSEVMESLGGFVILKLEAKQPASLNSAQNDIRSILQRERVQQELQAATRGVKAEFNLDYLDTAMPPELFPASALTAPSAGTSLMADPRVRMWSNRRKRPIPSNMMSPRLPR